MEHVKIVAEIGCNHRGEIETARRMIQVAALCGVDVVKFQKRNPRECLTPEQYRAPTPCPLTRTDLPTEHTARRSSFPSKCTGS